MKPLHKFFIFTVAVCLSFVSLKAQELKMNQTQVIGSHNSYKIGIEKPLMDLIVTQNQEAIGLAYTHIPLTEQLDLGLRSLEIDVVYDPEGGLFSHPKGLDMLTSMGLEPEPYNSETMAMCLMCLLRLPNL